MKKTTLILFTLLIGFSVFGQNRRNMRGNMNGVPQTNREPTEQEIEKHKRDIEERKQEFIANFVTTLEADAFQKEIIKQDLNAYFEKTQALMKVPFDRSFERQEAFKKLKEEHFKELKTLISENDMTKINEMLDGEFDEKEVKKKKRKKKKRKKEEG